jgi:site-specific DNA-methyltransferase (adenine-specific)
MRGEVFGSVTLYQGDCMEYMAGLKDKEFDLAVVDPPYGIDAGKMQMGKGKDKQWKAGKDWDGRAPNADYFQALIEKSKNQIIWGGNYFNLPLTGGWIFWDKERGKDVSFADGELAWTNFLTVLKKASIRYDGFIGADSERIHPTQKPVKLYEWLLTNYAKPDKRILDTHLGSGSSAIAAYYFGCEFVGIELDVDYFDAACRRIELATKQISLL